MSTTIEYETALNTIVNEVQTKLAVRGQLTVNEAMLYNQRVYRIYQQAASRTDIVDVDAMGRYARSILDRLPMTDSAARRTLQAVMHHLLRPRPE